MTTVAGGSNSPSTSSIRRHSRVELYENDRKQQRKQAAKFSLKKFFKLSIANNPYGIQFPPSHSSTDTSPYHGDNKCNSQVPFLDKEHEREIVEREKSKSKCRPEIIHPIDLQHNMVLNVPLVAGADHLNGGSNLNGSAVPGFPAVELVKITPKSTISPSNNKPISATNKYSNPNSINNKVYSGHFEKNYYHGNGRTAGVNKAGVNKSIISKSKLESYITTNPTSMSENSKNDSGHETSSIHTENSEGSASSFAMFSSSCGGSASSGDDTNIQFLKGRSSSCSNEMANLVSISSSSASPSQQFFPKTVRMPNISEKSNSTDTPPSSNLETDDYTNHYQSSSEVRLGVN